mgnify:CR=1 FL=1
MWNVSGVAEGIPPCEGCEAQVDAEGNVGEPLDYHVFYERNGYLKIPQFYSPEEMAELQSYVEEVQNAEEQVGGQMMYFEQGLQGQGRILRRTEDFAHRNMGIKRMFMDPPNRLIEFVSDLIAEDVILFKEKINFKLPGADGFAAHQDHQAGWGKYVNWFISIGVCIDEATAENGCLEVAGGYHKDGLLGQEWKPIEEIDLPYVSVPCKPGDIIVFDSFVPHRSFPNLSPNTRRMIFLTYNKAAEGPHRTDYFADKRVDFPPDIERNPGDNYHYRV